MNKELLQITMTYTVIFAASAFLLMALIGLLLNISGECAALIEK